MNRYVYTWYLRFLRDEAKLSVRGYWMGSEMGGFWVNWTELELHEFIRKYRI